MIDSDGVGECDHGGDGVDDGDADGGLTAEDPIHRHFNPAEFLAGIILLLLHLPMDND